MQILWWLGLTVAISAISQWIFWQTMNVNNRLGWSGRLVVWLFVWLPISSWIAWDISKDMAP